MTRDELYCCDEMIILIKKWQTKLQNSLTCVLNDYEFHCIFHLPFLDVVFVIKSSLTDDALHELGLSDEYSLIGVGGWGDMIFVFNWFVAESFCDCRPPPTSESCGWCELVGRWGYHDVGLRWGQHDSRIDWWRWLLLSKRSLSYIESLTSVVVW